MNLASLLDDHPGERTAIVAGGDRVSYGRLRDEIASMRGVLTSLGLEPGDRVAIMCGTNLRFVVAWLGAIGAGCVGVPLNPQSPAPEITRELAVVGARAIVAGPAGIAALVGVDRSSLPDLEFVLAPTGAALPDVLDGDALLAAAEPTPMVHRDDDDIAALLFTSGTAGDPKAAMLTHANLASNLRQVQANPVRAARPDDVALCVVPLFHVLGLNSILNLSLWAGATLVLVERFDPHSMVEMIRDEAVTLLVGPPTMWSALTDLPDAAPDAFATVRLAVSGAAALPERVAEAAAAVLGVRLYEGYGLTEASPSVTLGAGTDAPIGSIGRPIAEIEMRLVDDSGDDVYIGDPGEIRVRGPNVFVGYWDDPEATARAVDADGWLHTGDIAVVDDDGYLFLVDRAKDLIIVSGFNVYPAEVERVLVTHPAVADAAVTGVAHPHSGEAVKAFVVTEGETGVEEDELIAWCAAKLARYKCPNKVDVVDELPHGLTGKVLRRELQDRA